MVGWQANRETVAWLLRNGMLLWNIMPPPLLFSPPPGYEALKPLPLRLPSTAPFLTSTRA